MLGEPTTPLFSIAVFISAEPSQARAFATSVTSWRMTTSVWSVGVAGHRSIRDAGRYAVLLASIVTRPPWIPEVLDLEVDSQIFRIHRYFPFCENLFDTHATKDRARGPFAGA